MVLSQVTSRSLLNIINDRILRIQMNTALSQSRIIWWGVNVVLEFTPSSIANMNCCFLQVHYCQEMVIRHGEGIN
jgi:hypothetical protein